MSASHVLDDCFQFNERSVCLNAIASHTNDSDITMCIAKIVINPIQRRRLVAFVTSAPHRIIKDAPTAGAIHWRGSHQATSQIFREPHPCPPRSQHGTVDQKAHSVSGICVIGGGVGRVILLASVGVAVSLLPRQNRRVVGLPILTLTNLQTFLVRVTERLIPLAYLVLILSAVARVILPSNFRVSKSHSTTSSIVNLTAERKRLFKRRGLRFGRVNSVPKNLNHQWANYTNYGHLIGVYL